MEKIQKYRRQIDEIDDKIMTLLSDRFKCTDKIMLVKNNENIDTYDPDREAIILAKANDHSEQIYQVYQSILRISKDSGRSVK